VEATLELGLHYLRGQQLAFQAEIEGVRQARDPECVHRMRVAARRLRATLELLRPILGQEGDAIRSGFRRVARALGRARDLDVQIELLQELLGTPPREAGAGLRRLLMRRRQARACQQRRVHKALARLEGDRLVTTLDGALANWRARTSERLPLLAVVLGRVEELLAFAPIVRDARQVEALHRMRIAGKRLRYSLELLLPLAPQAFEPHIRNVKRLQEILGEIHDADVWRMDLAGFAEQERRRQLEFYGHDRFHRRLLPGLDFLRQDRRRKRSGEVRRLRRLWDGLWAEQAWGQLEAELVTRLGHPDAAAAGSPPAEAGE
jgi:CHAD domain-containing protein